MNITQETRRESNKKVDRQNRYNEILSVLTEDREMTSREIAYALKYSDLNAVKPRLTELKDKGIVEVIGKKIDDVTNVNVAIYRRKQ